MAELSSESGWNPAGADEDLVFDLDSGSGRTATSETIQVFCRIRPTKSPARQLCQIDKNAGKMQLMLPKDDTSGYVNNHKEVHDFHFNGIFDMNATQSEVFDTLARPIVNNFLAGINGTIFAYGQTGSGKTFSITGGTDSYEQRGIIPRALAMIFEEIAKRQHEYSYAIFISYLEIYNDNGYDLLDPSHDSKKLEDLPKVVMHQDEYGNVHLKNLNEQACSTIDEALNLLFVGDTNRMICETPSNDASSRSHCIFTITLEARQKGGMKVRRSKLHLVDLAGSERIKKTDIKGRILTEARYINLSLHYLEQVIVTLNQKAARSDKAIHVPYRNSMLTNVLRDSLGGNCKTAMLATMSLERNHLDESLSTARFAQRVAAVRNTAEVNETTDPILQVQYLKAKLNEIKEQLAVARGSMPPPQPLSDEDISRCQMLVTKFLESETIEGDDSAESEKKESIYQYGGLMKAVLGNPTKAGFCFELIRLSYRKLLGRASRDSSGESARDTSVGGPGSMPTSHTMNNQALIEQLEINIQQLRKELQQRENEINILIGLLKGSSNALAAVTADQAASLLAKIKANGPITSGGLQGAGGAEAIIAALEKGQRLPPSEILQASGDRLQALKQSRGGEVTEEEKQELVDRSVAFETFRNNYPDRDKIEENKETLKERITRAKSLGESINNDRTEISRLKERLEKLRLSRAAQHVAETETGDRPFDPESIAREPTEEERLLLQEIETRKTRYQQHYSELRELRKEIETLQLMLERQRHKLQTDFEAWFEKERRIAALAMQKANKQQQPSAGRSIAGSSPLAAPDLMSRFGLSPDASTAVSVTSTLDTGRTPVSTRPSSGASSTGRSSASLASAMSPGKTSSDNIPSVGNAQVDADIAAFYRLRDQVLKSK